MTALIVAGLLLGHALVHASYLAPEPVAKQGAPAWPFHLDRSWLLGPIGFERDLMRVLGLGLVVVALGAFALAAITALGVAPGSLWQPAVALGAVASLAVLVLYFHPWLVLGIAIDLVLLWAVILAGWAPPGLSG